MKINLCRDPALVVGATLRIRTKRNEYYVWHEGWRLRSYRVRA